MLSVCPDHWPQRRKAEVSQMILATLRDFLADARTSDAPGGVEAGFRALIRALEREEYAEQ